MEVLDLCSGFTVVFTTSSWESCCVVIGTKATPLSGLPIGRVELVLVVTDSPTKVTQKQNWVS